ncbi:MAG: Holliday junction branch migration protein RuvA [Candidatus Kaiserbacteria bacterium]|nr:Holliday junction branch migration protein RuvA [Candidatus Kaiserbacteria bacterium]
MIGALTGTVRDAGKDVVVVETGGGVGYAVTVSATTKNSILAKKSCTLYTHTAVRKDTIDLFGFLEQEEYSAFLLLISVSGVGPKKAFAVLDAMPVQTLLSAIQKEDVATLTSFGVGKKQAQRMVLDLQKKIEVDSDDSGLSGDLVATLVALGYEKREIADVLQGVALQGGVEEQVQEFLKLVREAKVRT